MLNDIVAHNVAQRIRIPSATAQKRLLPPRTRIASRFGAHPSGLPPLITKQPIQEQARARRDALLSEQRPHPTLHIPQRRCPQLKRRLIEAAVIHKLQIRITHRFRVHAKSQLKNYNCNVSSPARSPSTENPASFRAGNWAGSADRGPAARSWSGGGAPGGGSCCIRGAFWNPCADCMARR